MAFNRPRCTVTPCGKVTDEKRDGVVHVRVDRARISGRIAERQNYIVYILQRDNYTVVTDDGQRVSALQNSVVPTCVLGRCRRNEWVAWVFAVNYGRRGCAPARYVKATRQE